MTVDAHQHFWHYSPADYAWIDDSMGVIRRDFLPATLAPELASAGIDSTVAVQARQSLAETQWLLELARDHASIRGVVGWVPLVDPAVGAVLEGYGWSTKLKGVRHVVQAEPDPDFLAGAAFNRGLQAVTARNLVYDLLVLAPQLPAATAFVDRHPNQHFVLDHIAKPVVQGPPPAAWQRDLRALAERPNVSCKFSGVVTEVPGRQWTDALLQPYFDTVLHVFGPSRLMFGSDWPVCLVASSYSRWVGFVRSAVASLTPTERERILGGTAVDVYRLT